MPRRDDLELYVESELGDLLGLRFTSGSGNQLGDADLKPKAHSLDADIAFGFECKRTTRSKNHVADFKDWQKAKKQIIIQGRVPILVTQNSEHSKMIHMDFDDFKNLLEIAMEKGVSFL